MNAKRYEPFDTRGMPVMPTDEQLALMDEPERQRVQAVLDADAAVRRNRIHRQRYQDPHRETLSTEIADAENLLKTVAPPVTFMDLHRAAFPVPQVRPKR